MKSRHEQHQRSIAPDSWPRTGRAAAADLYRWTVAPSLLVPSVERAWVELDFGRSRRFAPARDIIAVHGARNYAEVEIEGASREKDVALLDRILDTEFVLVSADGTWSTKADELASLPASTWPHDNFEFEITRLDLYNENTAIISGEGRTTGTDASKPYCLRYQSSNVLIRRDIGWRAVLSHVSGVNTQCN